MSVSTLDGSPSIPVSPATLPPAATQPARSWARRAAGMLPNIVVFSGLGAVLYFGHRTGWELPRLSAIVGTAAAPTDDWCEEHLVPESQCVECNKDLFPRPKEFGFCRTHGVAECVLDHPELAQTHEAPQLPKYDTAKAISLLPRPENNSRNTLHKMLVQFASAQAAAKAGIDVDVVQERSITEALASSGEVRFDPTRVAHLSTKAPGSVAAVLKKKGDRVKAGEVVALIDAASVGQAKSQLLQAIVQMQLTETTVERLKGATANGAISKKSLIEAESEHKQAEIAFLAARQTLSNLGFVVPADVERHDAKQVSEELQLLGVPAEIEIPNGGRQLANLLPMRSVFEGTIVAADVARGEVVDAAKSLFTVADPSSMWLILNVRQEDARLVKEGLPVAFQPDDGTPEVRGCVSWLSPVVDERTRTLEVRVAIENADGRLRDNTFGTGRIILREEPNAITVPLKSVQSTSDAHFVFVRDKDYLKEGAHKVFHVRQVRIGGKNGDHIELLAGVLPGEIVATEGSGAILAQLLRSSFGAGCGCHEE